MRHSVNCDNFGKALLLSMTAGLCTGIGAIFVILKKRINEHFMSCSLGFAAGIMIYVSFAQIFVESGNLLRVSFGETGGVLRQLVSFFCGMAIVVAIEKFIPEGKFEKSENSSMLKSGILTAVAIALHNFPEGIATFGASVTSPSLGASIAFAIAVHNIPEGIAVAAPIYKATGKRSKTFFLTLASGLAEPLGGLIGFFAVSRLLNDAVMGILLAAVCGIMIFISVSELIPKAFSLGSKKSACAGFVLGMAVMAVGLLLE